MQKLCRQQGRAVLIALNQAIPDGAGTLAYLMQDTPSPGLTCPMDCRQKAMQVCVANPYSPGTRNLQYSACLSHYKICC